MSRNLDANAEWVTDNQDDMQVRVHTTRVKVGHYKVYAAVYVMGESGWTCPEGTVQVGTINKDTWLPSSQEWVSQRVDLLGTPASSGFHPTLSVARSRMGQAVLSSARKNRKA